jgi:hypothetical protein
MRCNPETTPPWEPIAAKESGELGGIYPKIENETESCIICGYGKVASQVTTCAPLNCLLSKKKALFGNGLLSYSS